MGKKIIHLLYCPFTGLGLFGGFRGNRWLRNRIKVFKQFVIPSLLAQTNQNFILWCSWRPEEKNNPIVKEFIEYLETHSTFPSWHFKVIHTFNGICFWDDKYPDKEAYKRLANNLNGTSQELVNIIGDADEVIVTLQPSDDLYVNDAVDNIQKVFKNTDFQAFGYTRGYMMNYLTGEVATYNPNTNPPFYSIRFPKDIFLDPFKHIEYAGIKSHEYVKDKLKYLTNNKRGFVVGCHSENISTHFSHPFKGENVSREVLRDFGVYDVPKLEIKTSLKRAILRKLPHKVQRKLRYIFGEVIWQRVYQFLRS